MSLSLIIRRVQKLFDDEGESWCDKDYVTGFIALNSDDLETELSAHELGYQEGTIVISDVPAGTTDLSAYQADAGPLASMMSPISVEWRRVGEDDSMWRPVKRGDKIIDVGTTDNQVEGIQNFTWQQGLVKISKSSIDVDLRVVAELLPDIAQSDSDNYIKGATNVIAYFTAQMIAIDRGGGVAKQAPFFEKKGLKALDNLEIILTKQEQNNVRRFAGRRSNSSGPLWRPPTG